MVKFRPLQMWSYGACSSMAERHTVDVDVEGSSPFRLPRESSQTEGSLCLKVTKGYLDFRCKIGECLKPLMCCFLRQKLSRL